MIVETGWQNDFAIAHLVGELDTHEAQQVWTELRQILLEEPRGCVIDLSHTTYIASLGLSILLKIAQAMRFRSIRLRLAEASPQIRTVLNVANLGRILPVDATVAEALSALEQAGPMTAPFAALKPTRQE